MAKRRDRKYLLTGRRSFFSSGAIIAACAIGFIVVAVVSIALVRKAYFNVPSVSSLYPEWNSGAYGSVYEHTAQILDKHPLDGAALAMRGFAGYYLFTEQTDPSVGQGYLSTSINSLRNAWYRVSDSEKPQIAYVLGKAYYQRGYYYADLSMKYLDYAYKAGFRNDDLAEFRGLSASLVGDYQVAAAAFTEALSSKPSDLLLFTLAKTYLKLNDAPKAKQYFYETGRTSQDELLQLKCKFEIGQILVAEGKYEEALSEFNTILEKTPNSADAHYGLGVLYETQGDLIKARAEWRKAVKADPVHAGARLKLEK